MTRRQTAIAGGILLLLCSLPLLSEANRNALQHYALAADGAHYETIECPPATPTNALCGRLTVPENRTSQLDENNRLITLPVVRLLPDKNIGAIPAVILGGGGPGGHLGLTDGNALQYWDGVRRDIMGADGELILTDQRGSGAAQPRLDCWEESLAFIPLLAEKLSEEEEHKHIVAALQQCQKRLQENAIDLNAYNTVGSADDIADLRRALDIAEWHLIGYSYGTRLALEVIRRHPQGVRSALLDSVLPYELTKIMPIFPNAAAIRAINARCQNDAYCRQFGDVADNLKQAMAYFERADITVIARHNGEEYPVALTPHRLWSILLFGLYDEDISRALPSLLGELAEGKVHSFAMGIFLANSMEFLLDADWADMLNYAVSCREEILAEAPPDAFNDWMDAFEAKQNRRHSRTCSILFPNQPPQSAAAVRSAVPILMISGDIDPATPKGWASAAAARHANARHISVPGAHTPSLKYPCLSAVIRDFFNAPFAGIADYCDNEQPLSFY